MVSPVRDFQLGGWWFPRVLFITWFWILHSVFSILWDCLKLSPDFCFFFLSQALQMNWKASGETLVPTVRFTSCCSLLSRTLALQVLHFLETLIPSPKNIFPSFWFLYFLATATASFLRLLPCAGNRLPYTPKAKVAHRIVGSSQVQFLENSNFLKMFFFFFFYLAYIAVLSGSVELLQATL